MKKLFILAVIVVLGLSVASCKRVKSQDAQEEAIEVTDSIAVETPADSTLVAE